MDLKALVEKTAVGNVGSISASSMGMTPEAFETVVIELELMEKDGRIQLLKKHQQSSIGKRLVDLVMFKRLR